MGDIFGDGYELISTTDYVNPYKTLKKQERCLKN